MNTSNPKFWALAGFFVGFLLAAGGQEAAFLLDAFVGGIIQAGVWFGIASFILRGKKNQPLNEQESEISLPRKLIGGFFFFGGVILVLGSSWGSDRSLFAPGLFNLVIGIPTFWPVLKKWLNRIPFSK